mmetsp:Transcript_8223/g.24692  ORF Transcript_8223/g.24692 Transcript_8223/m.24692 type:complete len:200 (-) Transcript_8223:638-1237(-)
MKATLFGLFFSRGGTCEGPFTVSVAICRLRRSGGEDTDELMVELIVNDIAVPVGEAGRPATALSGRAEQESNEHARPRFRLDVAIEAAFFCAIVPGRLSSGSNTPHSSIRGSFSPCSQSLVFISRSSRRPRESRTQDHGSQSCRPFILPLRPDDLPSLGFPPYVVSLLICTSPPAASRRVKSTCPEPPFPSTRMSPWMR